MASNHKLRPASGSRSRQPMISPSIYDMHMTPPSASANSNATQFAPLHPSDHYLTAGSSQPTFLHSHPDGTSDNLPTPSRFASDQYESVYSPYIGEDDDSSHNTPYSSSRMSGGKHQQHGHHTGSTDSFHTADTETDPLLSSNASTNAAASHQSSTYGSTLGNGLADNMTPSPSTSDSWRWWQPLPGERNLSIIQKFAGRVRRFIASPQWNTFVIAVLAILYLLSLTSEQIYRKSTITMLHNYRWSLYITITTLTWIGTLFGCIFTMPSILHNVHVHGFPSKAALYIGVLDGVHVLGLILSLSALPAPTAIILQQLILPLTLLYRLFHSSGGNADAKFAAGHLGGSLLILFGALMAVGPGIMEWSVSGSSGAGYDYTPARAEVYACLVMLSISMLSGAASTVYKNVYLSQHEVDLWLLNFSTSTVQLLLGLCLAPLSLQLQLLGANNMLPSIIPHQVPLPVHQPLPPHNVQTTAPAATEASAPLDDSTLAPIHRAWTALPSDPPSEAAAPLSVPMPSEPAAAPGATQPEQSQPQAALTLGQAGSVLSAIAGTVLARRYEKELYFSQTIATNYQHATRCLSGIDSEPHDVCSTASSTIVTSLIIWFLAVAVQHIVAVQLLKRAGSARLMQQVMIGASVVAIVVWLIPHAASWLVPAGATELWLTGGQLTPPVWLVIATVASIYGVTLLMDADAQVVQEHGEGELDAWAKLESLIVDDDEQRRIIARLIKSQHLIDH